MPSYKANFNYFDKIDTPDKAYWLGFIWADVWATEITSTTRGQRRYLEDSEFCW